MNVDRYRVIDMSDIDAVDYAVLKCIDRTDGCWKKCVHEWISDNIGRLPLDEQKSVQTIGRRIDALAADGLLESCILSPDAVNREMIIGYTLTEQGEQALARKQNELLRDMVREVSDELLTADDYDGDTPVSVDRDPLIFLMADAFDIDGDTRADTLPRIETPELVGVLAVHFLLDNIDDTFTPDHEPAVAALLEETPELRRPFDTDTVVDRLRHALTTALAQQDAVRMESH